jgi:hypothetical protein
LHRNECVSERADPHPNSGTPQKRGSQAINPASVAKCRQVPRPCHNRLMGEVIEMASKPESTPLLIAGCPDCGLPAEILEQFSLASTDGNVEHVALACVDGHYFRMPADRFPELVQVPAVAPAQQPSGLAVSRLPGFLGTVGSPAAAGGAAATRLPAAATVGSAAAGTPRPPGTAHPAGTA